MRQPIASTLVLVVALAACGDSKPPFVAAANVSTEEGGLCTSCGACEQTLSITGSAHVTGDIKYADPPPASGDHSPCWASWGVHDTAVGDEHWVHNLEHGGIVYLYRCGSACAEEVKQLAQFVEGRDRAMLTPYADLPTEFAVVAWGHRLLSDCFDKQAFEAFYSQHVDQGPESLADGPPSGCH